MVTFSSLSSASISFNILMAELITTGLGGSGTFEINSLELKLKNKPENPFQNYDVAKKTFKTNQNFSHYLWKKKHLKRNKSWIKCGKLDNLKQNRKPDGICPGHFFPAKVMGYHFEHFILSLQCRHLKPLVLNAIEVN